MTDTSTNVNMWMDGVRRLAAEVARLPADPGWPPGRVPKRTSHWPLWHKGADGQFGKRLEAIRGSSDVG